MHYSTRPQAPPASTCVSLRLLFANDFDCHRSSANRSDNDCDLA
jgi:hypothetical protein